MHEEVFILVLLDLCPATAANLWIKSHHASMMVRKQDGVMTEFAVIMAQSGVSPNLKDIAALPRARKGPGSETANFRKDPDLASEIWLPAEAI